MKLDYYKKGCDGCNLTLKHTKYSNKIIIRLKGNWVLNQYGGNEGFLGWLALQPIFHRLDLSELTKSEINNLGNNFKNVTIALKKVWGKLFPDDPIKNIYLCLFLEGKYDKPVKSKWHLHFHIIPRTKKMDKLLRKAIKRKSSAINAWKIYKAKKNSQFPKRYRENIDSAEYVTKLMTGLKRELNKGVKIINLRA